jgi:xylulokinase
MPIAFSYHAEALMGLGNFEEAFYSAGQALVLAVEDKAPESIGMAWRTLGLIAEKSGRPASVWERGQATPIDHDPEDCYARSAAIFAEAEIEAAKRLGVSPYDMLIKEAANAPAGCEGLYFLPYLTGERCPYPDPNARGAWVGITSRTSRAMMIRSLLEGVTYGMGDQINIMRQMGLKTAQVRSSGGGAMSKWWRQLQADIYDSEVVTINTSAGPAYGVAIMAMVGTGAYRTVPQACEAAIKLTSKVKTNRKTAALYKKHYELFPKLYSDLKESFGKIAKL